MNSIDAILFDLDGTLWDSASSVAMSWNTVFKEEGIDIFLTENDIKGVMGLLMDDIARKLLPGLDSEKRKEIFSRCCDIENKYIEEHGGKLFEKLEDTLKVLSQNYKLAIISNCQAGYIEAFLKAHKLQKYFCDFENPGRTGLVKGENIKLVINRNNFKNAIYVGDTQSDFEATKIANIPFVYAKYGFGDVSDYVHSIEKFKDLPKLVKSL